MIRIRDLRVDYDNVCAVRDLSLEVAPGEVCGLIGPNGAGKTTTMRAMIGLIEPTYGEINVMGVDVRERPQDVCRSGRLHARLSAACMKTCWSGSSSTCSRPATGCPATGGRPRSAVISRWSA